MSKCKKQERNKITTKEIQQMLKIIPNDIVICLEDLEEIYGIRFGKTMEDA